MYETESEVAALQELLDRSHAGATDHLQSIIDDDRRLTADDLVALLTGMKVLAVATVTAGGEPRISALDGHFLHGTWSFSTSGTAAKARHLAARPQASVAHVDGEEMAVFSHGQALAADAGAPALGRDARPLDAALRQLAAGLGSRHPVLRLPAALDGRLCVEAHRAAAQARPGSRHDVTTNPDARESHRP